MREITEALFALRDEKYRAFHAALMPGVAWERVIGVRMPALRRYAAALAKTPQAALFLRELPHTYYEENNLHALLLMREKSFETLMPWLERFLPRIDNWATCDLLKPVCFAKNREKLLSCVTRWLGDAHPYTVRFAIEMLMTHYLREDFSPEYPAWVAAVESDHYYIRMMQAWYFATVLAKNYNEALKYYFKVDYLDNKSTKAWRPIAWCSFLTGKYDQARNYYKKIMDNQPNTQDFLNAGHTEWALQNIKGALAFYKKAVEKESGDFSKFQEQFNQDIPDLLVAGIEEAEVPLMMDQLRYSLSDIF